MTIPLQKYGDDFKKACFISNEFLELELPNWREKARIRIPLYSKLETLLSFYDLSPLG